MRLCALMEEHSDTATAGDVTGGFEARIDRKVRRLHVRLWGAWSVTIAMQFIAAVDRLGTVLGPAPWTSLVDARRFGLQAQQLEPHRQESLKMAAKRGCSRMATVVDSSVYALQFKRLADSGHVVRETFADMASAQTWLDQASGTAPASLRRRPTKS